MRDKIFLMILLADNSIIKLVVDRVQQNPIFRVGMYSSVPNSSTLCFYFFLVDFSPPMLVVEPMLVLFVKIFDPYTSNWILCFY